MLIDAGSIIYPAFHVMHELKTRTGFPTGAIYGFARTLLKLLREYPSRYIAVAFDSRGETFRHKLYTEYKAHRPTMDEALAVQIPKVKELLDAFGIPMAAVEGFEADDLIATLTQHGVEQGFRVLIVSSDKDLMQLVNEKVNMLKPPRDPRKELELLDAKGVEEYLGVPPQKVIDFLALVGDAVDNVPGVPGIGEKTARDLLERFGSLEEILKNAESIESKRVRESLLAHKDKALLSKELVQLKAAGGSAGGRAAALKQPQIENALEQCKVKPPNPAKLKQLLEELEFRSVLKELELADEPQPQQQKIACRIVLDDIPFRSLLKTLTEAEEISLDLETTSQDALRAQIVGIALAVQPGEGHYIPFGHSYLGAPKQLDLKYVLEHLKPLLESKKIVGQNLKYDAEVLRRYGVDLKNIAFDSMLAAYLLDPTSRKDLNELAQRYLGHSVMAFKELGAEKMSEVPIDKAAQYAASDAEVVLRLKEKLVPELIEKNLYKLFTEVELPLIDVLVEMELNGILLDKDVLREQAKELEILLGQLKQEIFSLAGEEFNPNSPKQVAVILFEKLKLPVIKKTKTGPSTDSLVLQELAASHPLPEKLLAYRELEKLLTTYIYKLPEYINAETGRIHTSFHQSVTATGRLSSSDPNLQNIPVRTQLGGQIRRAFVAPRGRKLLAADYSQIELRVLAHISEDVGLIAAFERDEDIHARTAATIFNVSIEKVDPTMRDIAKRINFGLAYGMSSYGLAQWAHISRKEAEKFMQSYFASYPGVRAYMERTKKEAAERGYVETLLGRRRYFGQLDSRTEREAINMPIQGFAADIMKLAMLQVHGKIKSGELEADLLLQVHDELLFEVDEAHIKESAKLIKETMEHVMKLRVPLKVDIKVGNNWGEI